MIVTGTTGLVGLRTLAQLRHTFPTRRVIAPIRATSDDAARSRLLEYFERFPMLNVKDLKDIDVCAIKPGETIAESLDRSFTSETLKSMRSMMHIAADTSWTKSKEEMLSSNHRETMQLSELVLKHGLPNFVFASTLYVQPVNKLDVPLPEARIEHSRDDKYFSPYAEVKLMTENYLDNIATEHNLNLTIARIGTVTWDSETYYFNGSHGFIAGTKSFMSYPDFPEVLCMPHDQIYPVAVNHCANVLISAVTNNRGINYHNVFEHGNYTWLRDITHNFFPFVQYAESREEAQEFLNKRKGAKSHKLKEIIDLWTQCDFSAERDTRFPVSVHDLETYCDEKDVYAYLHEGVQHYKHLYAPKTK